MARFFDRQGLDRLRRLGLWVFCLGLGLQIDAKAVAADRPDETPAQAAVNENRLRGIEARLADLERQLGTPATRPERADDPLQMADWMQRMEERLMAVEAGLEGRRGTEGGLAVASSSPSKVQPLDPDRARNAPEVEERPKVAELRALYLPSRGRGGGALHYGAPNTKLELHAFLDLEYIDAGPDGSRGGVSTFDSHHANLFVRSQLRPDLLAHMEIEYEHGGDTVEIDQAFLAWAVTDRWTLRAGRFYNPFGIERFVWYSPTNALVSRPAVMREIVPGNFYATGLASGGVIELNGGRLNYELALTDGLGGDAARSRRDSRQTRDNNSSRAISGRLGYAPGSHLEVGSSLHHQRYADDQDLDLTFFGLDLAARWRGWELRSEWVDATIEEVAFDDLGLGSDRVDLDQQGWYLQLAYAFTRDRDLFPELQLVSRYDELDLDASIVGNDDRRLWAVGANLMLVEHLRVKAEYQFVSEDGAPRQDDVFRFQLVIDY